MNLHSNSFPAPKFQFQNMASTSSATPSQSTPKLNYEVFLSFRGEDVRKNFLDHLYDKLKLKGINTFKDDEGLEKGDSIRPRLLQAIEESRVAIVIFSKDYASSTWCLEEVATIMECKDKHGLIVVPIFYNVKPSHVRKQQGSFEKSFAELEKRFNNDVGKTNIERWKKALAKAADIKGHNLVTDYNGYEAVCVQRVTDDIFSQLNKFNQATNVLEKNIVGLESRVGEIRNLLRMEPNDVQFIGIWGMGGIGKTTTARAVFNKFLNQFGGGACFLADVRQCNIIELQKTLIKTILNVPTDDISNVHTGMETIQTRLKEKKVLIVLDDVDHVNQLDKLAGDRHWFGGGSRVIITTRDAGVLRRHGVDQKYIYEVHTMEDQEAIQLFRYHAFKKEPKTGFEELCGTIVDYCKGLPLALQVLGSSLCGLEAAEWKSTLEELKISLVGTPNDEIDEVLKISFDRLDSNSKTIFLHIACFFRNRKEEYVKDALKSCDLQPVTAMRYLIEKSLISVLDGKIEMHDLIQEMGWRIASLEKPRSRVWHPKDVDDVLSGKMEPKHIEGFLFSSTEEYRDDHNSSGALKVFEGMEKLKILIVEESSIGSANNIFCVMDNYLPSSLMCLDYNPSKKLSWEYHSFLENCLLTKELNQLTYLDLSYSYSLLATPNFELMPNLKKLNLSGCGKLKEIHPSVGRLKKLVLLDLSHCDGIKELPVIIKVSSLKFLKLEGCRSLAKFPEIQTDMPDVMELNLESISIRELPSSIQRLCGLTKLRLCDCKNLDRLSNDLCELESLKILELRSCVELESLPENLGNLSNLEELHIFDTAIFELPSSVTRLSSLNCLCLVVKNKFGEERTTLEFGPSVASLCSLKRLELSNFNIPDEGLLSVLECLISLEYLSFWGSNFVKLPERFSQLPRLQYLDIRECGKLEELPKLPKIIRELYVDPRVAYRGNILAELATEYSQLYLVAFSDDYDDHNWGDVYYSLANKCIHFPFRRNTCFSVSYPIFLVGRHDDGLRSFQYRCYYSNEISIDLNPHWYSQRFMGFAVFFVTSSADYDMWEPHSYKGIYQMRHCAVIAELSVNGNEVLQTKCLIAGSPHKRHVCFAYIPFNILWPESKTKMEADKYSRFNVKFSNLKASAVWGCSLLYKRDEELASWDGSLPGRTTDIGPLTKLEYLNLSGKKNIQSLPKEISQSESLKYLDISGCKQLMELPELPENIRELYAPYSWVSESDIAELATKYSQLYSVSFSYATFSVEKLARKFAHVPFQIRNSPFVVSYPTDWDDDINNRRWLKYQSRDSNKISIDLNPFWYRQAFLGFVVYFLLHSEDIIWESSPHVGPFRHGKVTAELIHKDNANEVLQTNCVFGEQFNDYTDEDELICFAYIPICSLLSKYGGVISKDINDYLVFEVAFLDSNASKNWSCGLLYQDDESLSEAIREIASTNDSDSEMEEHGYEEAPMTEHGIEEAPIAENVVNNAALFEEIQPDPIIEEDCESTTSQQQLGLDRTKPWELTGIVHQGQFRMVSMPECSDAKVVRLLYEKSGVGILALSSNGIQKLWNWLHKEQNPSGKGVKATANFVPQHWQTYCGLVLSSGVSGVNLEEVVPCIDLSKDGYVVAAAGRTVLLYNMLTFKEMKTIMLLPSASTFLAFHPRDNNIIAIGMEESSIYIYDCREDDVWANLKGHQKHITGLAFSTNLNMLVSSGADAQLYVWSIDTWEKIISVPNPIQLPAGEGDTQVMFHVDQVHLLVTHETQLAIYDASKMELVHQWTPHASLSAPISSVTYSCDSKLVYASFIDGNIGVLDAHTLTPRCRIAPFAYLSPVISIRIQGVYPVAIAAHPQEPNQFAVGLTDGYVKVIEPLESVGSWEASPPIDSEILMIDW